MKPFKVRLRFHGDLNVFLRSRARDAVVERSLAEKTSIKDVIESCGVPHPEVDLVLVDDQPVGFGHTVDSNATVEVLPVEERGTIYTDKRLQNIGIARFVSDGHLGSSREIFVCSDLMSPTSRPLMTASCSR